MELGPWNWLEIAKLGAGLLTPAALAVGGIYIHRVTKRFEHMEWRSQKLIEKRLLVYDDMAPLLNDILCYFTYVGSWRDFDPPSVVALKRVVDKKLYIAAPLFGEKFFHACIAYQNLCFKTFTAWGQDAKLRTQFTRRQEARPKDWKAEWSANFCDEVSDPKEISSAYNQLMQVFAEEIGVHSSFAIPPPARLPANIR